MISLMIFLSLKGSKKTQIQLLLEELNRLLSPVGQGPEVPRSRQVSYHQYLEKILEEAQSKPKSQQAK